MKERKGCSDHQLVPVNNKGETGPMEEAICSIRTRARDENHRHISGIVGMYAVLATMAKSTGDGRVSMTMSKLEETLGLSPSRAKEHFDLLSSWGFLKRIRTNKRGALSRFGPSFVQVYAYLEKEAE